MTWLIALAFAQDELPEVNANLFRPSIDNPFMIMVDESGRGPTHYKSARALTSYAYRPLVYTTPEGDVVDVLSGVAQEDSMVAWTLGRVRLGTSIPAYAYTRGEVDEKGRGDWSGEAKVTVLDPSKRWLGLAFSGRVTAPTGVVPTLTSPKLGWEGQVIADHQFGDVLVVLNVGYQGLPQLELGNVLVDDRVVVRGGIGWVGPEVAGLALEGIVSSPVSDVTPWSVPAELMASGWVDLGERFNMRLGVGTGLSRAPGVPQARAVWAIAYEPPRVLDSDGDGLGDDIDVCMDEPEDEDGFRDDDGCPEPTNVTLRYADTDGFVVPEVSAMTGDIPLPPEGAVLWAGQYEVTVEHPGFAPTTMLLDVPEGPPFEGSVTMTALAPGQLRVRIEDTDGNPVSGAFWALDGEDRRASEGTELDAGEHHLAAFADGHAPDSQVLQVESGGEYSVTLRLKRTTARLTEDRIELGDSLYFLTESAEIKPESFALLDDVAAILLANPQVRVRVEGHTDERGDAGFNQSLSQARAASVRSYLVDAGVPEDRLESAGFGESKPLVEGHDEDAWSQNRRVDFVVF